MSTTLLNLESFADALQEFSKSSQKYWRKNACYISLCRWLFRKNNDTINWDDNNDTIETEDEPVYCLDSNEFLQIIKTMQKFSLSSKDGAIAQSYANHVARIIDQHFAEKSRQTTVRDYFQGL